MLQKIAYIFDKHQKRNLAILFVIMFVGGFMELLGVSLIMPIVTIIIEPDIMNTNKWMIKICSFLNVTSHTTFILLLLIAMIIIYIIKNLYLTMMYHFQFKFTYNNQRRLALRLMTCYMNQDYLFHLSRNTSELQRNVMTDVNQFFSTILNFIQLFAELITCLFLVLGLMSVDFWTTFGVVLVIGLFVLMFYVWFRKSLGRLGRKFRQEQGQLIKWIQQSFGGIKEVKVMSREAFFLRNYDESYRKVSIVQRKQSIMQLLPKPVLETISICGILSVLAVRTAMGADLSQFIPTLSLFAIAAFRLLPAFNRITAELGSIMFTKASVNAVYEDLKEVEQLLKEKEIENKDSLELQIQEKISIQDVSFKYPNTEQFVLDHIVFEIPARKSVALIGPSGAGKTTLADVILGVLKPETGTITVDGVDVFEHMHSWHKLLGYIPQTIYLMDDTIRNNVTFGIPESEVDEEQVWTALREAQLETFVQGLEKGLDTVVGERGVRLSGGQRQRIGIARALYSNPQILVLDEATSALDNETETAVMEAIDSLQGNKTMIIIAHRLTTIRNCDFIYEVSNGKITLKDKKDVFM